MAKLFRVLRIILSVFFIRYEQFLFGVNSLQRWRRFAVRQTAVVSVAAVEVGGLSFGFNRLSTRGVR